jgi:hypothetical protein
MIPVLADDPGAGGAGIPDRGSPCGALTFLETKFGKPFTANGLGNWFRRRATDRPAPLQRPRAAQGRRDHCRRQRCNLVAIFGWKTIKQAEVYTQHADQKRVAGVAMGLLVPMQFQSNHEPLLLTAKSGSQGSGETSITCAAIM